MKGATLFFRKRWLMILLLLIILAIAPNDDSFSLLPSGYESISKAPYSTGAYLLMTFNDSYQMDAIPLNYSMNFTQISPSSAWISTIGRNGSQGYSFYYVTAPTGGNFLFNASNPLQNINDSGTLCFSVLINSSLTSGTLMSAGEGGGGLCYDRIRFVTGDVGQPRFRREKDMTAAGTCGAVGTEGTIVNNYNVNPEAWFSICTGWNVGSWWMMIINATYNVSVFNATTLSTTGLPAGQSIGYFGIPEAASNSRWRIGAAVASGGADVGGNLDLYFDEIVSWNHNLTLEEIWRYHAGNWTRNVTEKMNLTVYFPANNTFSNNQLNVSVFGNTTRTGNPLNFSLLINGTFNRNITNISISDGSMSLGIIVNNLSTINLTNGTWYWMINLCEMNGTGAEASCRASENFTYSIDTEIPRIQAINPNGTSHNVSLLNLTLNINFTSDTLNVSNISVYFPNGTMWTSLYNLSDFTNFDTNKTFRFERQINFSSEFNYSINITAISFTKLNITVRTYYFFDMSAPNVNITTVSENQVFTTTSPNITINVTDKVNSLTCYFQINQTRNEEIEVAMATFPCTGAADDLSYLDFAALTSNRSYVITYNATDSFRANTTYTLTKRFFRVDDPPADGGGGGGGGGGAGGGGGSTTIIEEEEKPVCRISTKPTEIFISKNQNLKEVKIINDDTLTYSPSFKFSVVEGKNDYSNFLKITNAPTNILQKTTVSFGVKYEGISKDKGENLLTLTSSECANLEIKIKVNQEIFLTKLEKIYKPELTFKQNMEKLLLTPTFSVSFLSFLKNWLFFIIMALLSLLFNYSFLKDLLRKNKQFQFIFAVLFVNILIPITLTLIAYYLGG